jgi:threonine aldolase
MLVGTKDFIHRARRNRKMLGGGMRQVGVLAAAGLLSLKEMTLRLSIDHKHAKYLAEEFAKLEGFTVDLDRLDINMVFVKSTYDLDALKAHLGPKQILLGGYKGDYMRFVCHKDVTKEDIDLLIKEVKDWTNIRHS